MSTEPVAAANEHEIRGLLEKEQVRLSVEQVRRIPVPHFFVDACVAWSGWHAGLSRAAWIWFAVMTIAQVGRTIYAVNLDRRGALDAHRMLDRLANLLSLLGAIQAVFMVMLFTRPIGESHYIFTMIMVGNAAGAVSPAAGHLKSYILWSTIFGGTLAACWLSLGTLEGAAIALLLVFLFSVLAMYVRDQGRTLETLVTLSQSLRRERDRAERASEAKTRFFAAASHDLRQPLTALSYNAATVQALAQVSGDETLTRVGDGIQRALAESRGLLDSLLEVSELDAGAVEVDFETVDVGALLIDIQDTFAPLAADRGLALSVQLDRSRLLARTDAALLRRIIQNLVGNAVKFTTTGTITVEAHRFIGEHSAVHVVIRDTGPGIPHESLDRVFEEFYQVGNTERNRSRGLGLGLAIVRRLAKLLDTDVTLTSSEGIGSTFEIRLPLAPGPHPATASRDTQAPFLQKFAHGAHRLLLVDDEPDIRESLSTFLTTVGWVVEVAADQDSAQALVKGGFEPDALIVDFRLRDGASGLDALAALRRLGVDAPAWLITGDTEPARISTARAAGVPVLYKPVNGMELLSMLNAKVRARVK